MASKRVSDAQFAESKHQYTDPRTGLRLTSVTSIVGCFDPGDKLGAGAGAATKLMREGKNYREIWSEAAARGTRLHGYAELWAQGRQAEVSAEDEMYLNAFALFCDEHGPSWIEVERAVVGAAGFGGRFDLIGEFDDQFVLVDIKSGKCYLPELTLQLAGYRFADGMIVYDENGMAVALEPMPHIDACAGLYLHDDGTYDLQYVSADLHAFEQFRNLLQVKTWAKGVGK